MKSFIHRKDRNERKKGSKGQYKRKQKHDFVHALKGSLETEHNKVLTTEEAANYLRVSVGTLRNMTSDGLVPYTKLGSRNRYFLNELQELLRSNRKGGSYGI